MPGRLAGQGRCGEVVNGVVVHEVQTQRAVAANAADGDCVHGAADRSDLRKGGAHSAGGGHLEVSRIDAGDGLAERNCEADAAGVGRWTCRRGAVDGYNVGRNCVDGVGLAGEVAVEGVEKNVERGGVQTVGCIVGDNVWTAVAIEVA
jgi:hypothetical protein